MCPMKDLQIVSTVGLDSAFYSLCTILSTTCNDVFVMINV